MTKLLWEEVALKELSALWMKHNPDLMNLAIKVLQNQLEEIEPEQIGESRNRLGERICIVEPLCFFFNIEFHNRERVAVVQHVWTNIK